MNIKDESILEPPFVSAANEFSCTEPIFYLKECPVCAFVSRKSNSGIKGKREMAYWAPNLYYYETGAKSDSFYDMES